MEVSAEAKRIMVVALGKLYSSRSQRGGLRLHRSLLLTMVMKSARDIYHEAQTTTDTVALECQQQQQQQQIELTTHAEPQGHENEAAVGPSTKRDKENRCPRAHSQQSRKRRGKAAAEPDFLPCKKAKLEQGSCPQQLLVSPVLMDYVNCSSGLGPRPPPVTLHRAVAACC